METQTNDTYGKILSPGVIRFKRLLPGPIEKVWAYLTESKKKAKWLAAGKIELKIGGRVELHFRHSDLSERDIPIPEKYKDMEGGHKSYGRVTEIDPPYLLSYTWGEDNGDVSEVTFELTPEGDQVLLVLTHRNIPGEYMVSAASGWHTHLGILVDVMEGRAPRGFWEVSVEIEKEYRKKM